MRARCSFGTTLSSWSSLERRWNSMRLAGQHWYLKLHFTIKTTDLTFLKCLLFAFMGIKCLLFRNEIFKKAHHLNFEKFKFLAIAALVLLRFQIHQIRNFQFESNQFPKNHLLNVTTVNSKKNHLFSIARRWYWGLWRGGSTLNRSRSANWMSGTSRGRPCAHWNGTSHWLKPLTSFRQHFLVNWSPNLMAPANERISLFYRLHDHKFFNRS